MNMKRRTAMGDARIAGCALVLFASLVLSASSVVAQPCAAVVYAFRHAEDTNPPGAHPPVPIFALTPTGQAHAALYPAMINDFQAATHFCPVTRVYATTTVDKEDSKEDPCGTQCASATNAFDTATPLARAVMSADPITTVGNGAYRLYEYLGNGNKAPTTPNYFTPTANALRAELLATASRYESSAIFWTSQGLHVLGGVIINAFGKVPIVSSNVPPKNGGAIPPRNAVYIFVYQPPDNPSDIPGFSDTPSEPSRAPGLASSVFVQCFNHIEATNQVSSKDPNLIGSEPKFIDPAVSPPQRYYCGYDSAQSNLGGKPYDSCDVGARCGSSICNDPTPSNPVLDASCKNKSNRDIKGKICYTGAMLPDSSGSSIFGACQ
jgi:hypothetical protein